MRVLRFAMQVTGKNLLVFSLSAALTILSLPSSFGQTIGPWLDVCHRKREGYRCAYQYDGESHHGICLAEPSHDAGVLPPPFDSGIRYTPGLLWCHVDECNFRRDGTTCNGGRGVCRRYRWRPSGVSWGYCMPRLQNGRLRE